MTAWLTKRPKRMWFHFGCGHTRAHVGLSGRLVPNPAPNIEPWRRVVWLADPEALRLPEELLPEALGLTSLTLSCDRTEYCYRVERAPKAGRWLDSPLRTPDAIAQLEGPVQRPDLWWVSPVPVRAVLAYRFGRSGPPGLAPDHLVGPSP